MTVHICREPDESHPNEWLKRAAHSDTIKFPGVDSCLAMAFLMSNGSMVGAHVGVFWAGQSEMSDDCAKKMLKAMLDCLHVSDGRIAKFLMITDLARAADAGLKVGGGGTFANEGSFYFDTNAREAQVRLKRSETIDMCVFNKVTGAVDIELNGNASLLTIHRSNRTVLSVNFSKIKSGTTDIPN
ncbi:hypothetical protein [Methylicorpusculum sp.]|uniref:hypothetical protein n=1 Tax=Methylicorpusculum sp. TaxID=2713644 RepID=UPI00271D43BC|nr:hypothetical protein [Methylicorpusculum sp.]MDO8846360.1 hypothetical protein [Methylicorpusculum sp.]